MTATVTVVGSLNMDLVVRAPHIPVPGETIIGSEFRTVPGGKGANQAVAAARLGAQVSMIGRVGGDAFAGSLLESLAAAGVDCTLISQDPQAATGIAMIVVEDSGENCIVVASGANMLLSPGDMVAAERAIAAADVCLLQLESPLEVVTRAAEVARGYGVPVVLNPAPARPLPAALLASVDVLVPNESEAALLTSLPVDDLASSRAAACALLTMGVDTVIVTLGERGALLAREGSTERFPAFAVTPVDSTAAGDAFLGGLAVAVAEGRSMADAVRWGNAAGALATTKLGAQPSLPTRGALEALLAAGTVRASSGARTSAAPMTAEASVSQENHR